MAVLLAEIQLIQLRWHFSFHTRPTYRKVFHFWLLYIYVDFIETISNQNIYSIIKYINEWPQIHWLTMRIQINIFRYAGQLLSYGQQLVIGNATITKTMHICSHFHWAQLLFFLSCRGYWLFVVVWLFQTIISVSISIRNIYSTNVLTVSCGYANNMIMHPEFNTDIGSCIQFWIVWRVFARTRTIDR